MTAKITPRVMVLDVEATSLNADNGHVVCIGWIGWDKKHRLIFVKNPKEEKRALAKFMRELALHHIYITWNGEVFDVPFLIARCLKNSVDPAPLFKARHVDLAQLVKNHLKLSSASMWTLCRFLDIKKDYETIGADVPSLYLAYLAGKRASRRIIMKHCMDDLKATFEIFKRLWPVMRHISRDLPNLF